MDRKLKLHDKYFKPFISNAEMEEAIDRLAERVNADFRDSDDVPIFLCVLNGAIMFTAAQFPGVKQVKIAVEGQEYQPPQDAAATFLNQDTEIMAYYPGVIEID